MSERTWVTLCWTGCLTFVLAVIMLAGMAVDFVAGATHPKMFGTAMVWISVAIMSEPFMLFVLSRFVFRVKSAEARA